MIDGKKIVALCTYGIHDPQVFSFISDLNEKLRPRNSQLFIYTMNTELGSGGEFYMAESSVYDLVPYDRVDAVVIMAEKIKSPSVVQHIIDRCKEKDIPAIVIDGDFEDVSLVKFDYAKGFESVVRHMIEDHKVKRPHFMAGKRNNEFSDQRIEVFKKVIEENGIAFEESMISYGDFWSVPARLAASQLLKRNELPDAIICANDIMAINVCDVFESAGVSVPGQVLVSGFDGIDEAFLTTPGITTAICDSKTLANTIMDVIMRVFAGEKNIISSIVPTFIANESCGCPRANLSSMNSVHEFNNRFYHHQDDIHIMRNFTAYVISSENLEECAYHFRHSYAENMCCVIEDSCLDFNRNYFIEDVEDTTKTVIYDYYKTEDKPYPYDPEGIIPNLDMIIEKGYPPVFNALEFMGKTIGFVCYSFEKYNLIDYFRTPTLTNSIELGLGGYITMHNQRHLREEIRRMYQNDELTGLYNRLAFIAKLKELKEEPDLIGKKITVLMADLNGLKQINDTLGHTAGDKAIAAVADALRSTCPPGSLCVRFGGDELLALIPGEGMSDKIIAAMQAHLRESSREQGFPISASYGTTTTVFDEDLNIDQIIGKADEKMYDMKKKLKGQ
ncbi:diguanylate cyclase [Butyrivibrio sp. FCS014]|uniref:diguanylate cyclase n=1 Tax=Butyrivibrio sp. FCS014 TaxID=1408304 RepID=UPI0004679175|nr:GGDEF domain-containing protein [Butyrivibrio sp. FCS014]